MPANCRMMNRVTSRNVLLALSAVCQAMASAAATPDAETPSQPAVAAAAAAPSARGCPAIRPPGLGPAEVDALVLGHVAHALQQSADQLDRAKSFAQLAPGPEAAMRFQWAARAIGETLGLDAPGLFMQVARLAGREPAHAGLALDDLLTMSRQAYAQGQDEAPPPVSPQAEYQLGEVRLRAPQLAPGWTLLRCGQDQVIFWRKGAVDDEAASAVARLIGLPPFIDQPTFASHLRQVVAATVPAGHVVRRLEVEPVEGSPQPCAEAVLLARHENLSFRLRGRFCYAAPDARHGPAILFSTPAATTCRSSTASRGSSSTTWSACVDCAAAVRPNSVAACLRTTRTVARCTEFL